jgi:hypothetical protein
MTGRKAAFYPVNHLDISSKSQPEGGIVQWNTRN